MTIILIKSTAVALSLFVALVCTPLQTVASPILPEDLASFAVLGASTVTNVPTSAIQGNVGVWPGTSITGFNSVSGGAVSDPQVTSGLVNSATPLTQSAGDQLTRARNNLLSFGEGTLLPSDLTGLTLLPGIYTVPAAATNLTGTLTLDAGGYRNAAWVFQMPSTLITSYGSVVQLIGGGSHAGVFWNVGSSATLHTYSTFIGNILAYASISAKTGAANTCGRLLAQTAAVTLEMNSVSGICNGFFAASNGLSGGLDIRLVNGVDQVGFTKRRQQANGMPDMSDMSEVPLPYAFGMLALGIAGLFAVRRKRPGA